ncbi:MAG TPA: FAD-linked oxidase C-terminal domain-containing protein [Terriglobales bacterium]|nr:FAD-linked oxidase C-terminal domain-containing protein [Terriglobales bacterium]
MRLSAIARQLRKTLGRDAVLDRPEDLMLYEYDAGVAKATPGLVVFPQTTEHVVAVVKAAREAQVSIVPRGAGTGLSGGSISRDCGIVMVFSRMNRILELDLMNLRAVVQPGVVNLDLSAAVNPEGFYFAPDPSSQRACTIGGNVAANSGGPHTLAYGVTVNHVTGMEVVLADGHVARLGGKAADSAGYDLTGFFVGTEGTLGIVTAVTVKLSRISEAVSTMLAIFNTVDDAANTVVALTAGGITPTALEMLDGWTLRTVEEATHAGYPMDSGAVLLIEVEGLRESIPEQQAAVTEICRRQNAREVRIARNETERQLLWAGRKNAFAAIGRLANSYYTQDGVVPRTRIPATLRYIDEVGKKYGVHIGNVFHAGDGNLHPVILYDLRDPEQVEQVHRISQEILQWCVELGGSITGEHGVGLEKQNMMPMMFSPDELEVMERLRRAINPSAVLNPGKILPTTLGCGEINVARARPRGAHP